MVHVVYTIRKRGSSNFQEIVVNSDPVQMYGRNITGGLIEELRKDYPEDIYVIDVEVLISHGN